MKQLLALIFLACSLNAQAMGDDYKKMPNGGYVFTGGSHLKGCSNKFTIGVSTKQFVVDCMKIDSLGVRNPDRVKSYTTAYSHTQVLTYGRTQFYFRNGILDTIIN